MDQPTEVIQKEAKRRLKGKIVIGHGIGCDFQRLRLCMLKYICTQNLGVIPHTRKKHCPVEDARGSLALAVSKF